MGKDILNNINGYPLDDSQKKVVTSNDNYILVSAGAGSGKTLTIVGKIRYLIEVQGLKDKEIICISFTNDATNSLSSKLKDNYHYDIPCYTFHKLGLEILSKYNYIIAKQDELYFVINEFFDNLIYYLPNYKAMVLNYLRINYSKKSLDKKYNNIDSSAIKHIKSVTGKFINLFKANDFNVNDFIGFINKERIKRNKYLLIIVLSVYLIYQNELISNGEIDFNDMICLAIKRINEDGYNKLIKYIIVDEFQDTSLARFNLIKAIINKTGSKLLAVGDDFQSIYRFTGCDLSLFLNFNNIFKTGRILKIENTYRNSQELIDIAGSFVMKNDSQLKKDLKSTKHIDKPIVIVYYSNIISVFIELVKHIYKNSTKKTILVLGRNNSDINMIVDNKMVFMTDKKIIIKDNPLIDIYFLTVHRSKGLEEDNVIIINLTNKDTGFPNKLVDDDIIKYVKCEDDKYLFAEERRLFYVAITRTKNKVYLLCPKQNKSIFVKELERDFRKRINFIKNNKFK